MKQIKVKTLTAESFKEFGSFTDFMNPEGYSLGDFYQDRLRMHSSGSMQMTFSPLLIHKPEKNDRLSSRISQLHPGRRTLSG